MAIKISNTTVIDDTRQLTNIASIDAATKATLIAANVADATSANTADKVVARDASGNFSAGTITATLNGNASSATTLQTARTISLTGDVTGSVAFSGSGDVSIAATVVDNSHSHSYLPLTGGTVTGTVKVNGTINGTAVTQSATDGTAGKLLKVADFGIGGVAANLAALGDWDGVRSLGSGFYMGNGLANAPTTGWLIGRWECNAGGVYGRLTLSQFTSATASSQRSWFRTLVNGTWSAWRENYTEGSTINATTATRLQTARAINGTNFNGSAAITTANWGTARTITIGNTGKSVNGSAAVSWTLAEIGAAATSHTHSAYVPTSRTINGNALTANITLDAADVGAAATSHTHSYLPLSGGSLTGAVTTTSTIVVNNTTASTSSTTGSLRTTGGLGVGGAVYAAGNVTAYSDIRLKTDIQTIENALEKVCAIRGVTYLRIDSGERQTGVIAQEVQKVLPEAVSGDEYLGVAYGNLAGLLIEAIKEQQQTIAALNARLEILENRTC